MIAVLLIGLLFICSTLAQEPAAPPPPVHEYPKAKAATPQRIRLNEADPFVPLAHPTVIRVVQSFPRQELPTYSPPGIDLQGISYGEVPLVKKLELIRGAQFPSSSPEASNVINSARKFCSRFVNVAIPEADSIAILTHDGEDVAVAGLKFVNRSLGISNAWLWDEPVATSLLIQVPSTTLSRAPALEQFMNDLFTWRPNGLSSVALELLCLPRAREECLRGHGWFHILRQVNIGPELTISGFMDHGLAWLGVTLHKTMIGYDQSDPDMSFIAERFPPLRTRLPSWTTAQLLAAIGKGGRAETRYNKAFERSGLLLQELMLREDFTSTDFRHLVDTGTGNRPSMGPILPEVIRQAARAENGTTFIPEIIGYFARIDAERHLRAEIEARELMLELNRDKRADLCGIATSFQSAGLDIENSSKFRAKFCTSP